MNEFDFSHRLPKKVPTKRKMPKVKRNEYTNGDSNKKRKIAAGLLPLQSATSDTARSNEHNEMTSTQ